MQWLEVKIKTFKKTASLSEKGCWCWLALWEITNKVSCDVDGLEYHLRYQTYHLWMKGLSTEREDNIFFHMFSLQKKNLIETGKSKQKQKNKDYGFFFISHCHLSGHLQPGKVNSKNQNRKSSANKSPPQKKKIQIIKPYHPKTHNSAAAPFFGGIGKKIASQRLAHNWHFSPEPNLVMDREVPPSEARCPTIRDGKSGVFQGRNLELQKRCGVLCDDFYYSTNINKPLDPSFLPLDPSLLPFDPMYGCSNV